MCLLARVSNTLFPVIYFKISWTGFYILIGVYGFFSSSICSLLHMIFVKNATRTPCARHRWMERESRVFLRRCSGVQLVQWYAREHGTSVRRWNSSLGKNANWKIIIFCKQHYKQIRRMWSVHLNSIRMRLLPATTRQNVANFPFVTDKGNCSRLTKHDYVIISFTNLPKHK